MIKRHISKILNKLVNQYPVILLTGPRQVGKSTLLKFQFNSNFKYFSLEDIKSQKNIFDNPDLFLKENPYPLIIDEAQLAPTLFSEINAIVNQVKMTKGNDEAVSMYILSGSNKGDLLEKTKESLAGRIAYINMFPLSLNEIYNRDSFAFDFNESIIKERSKTLSIPETKLFEHILNGFMPGLYDSKNRDLSYFYSGYVESYIEKDLKQMIEIKHKGIFVNFMCLLASNIGQELILTNYSKLLGVSLPTIKSWIDALERSGIIYLLKPYNELSITKRIVKRPKMYFFDTGLAAYLVGIDSPSTLMKSIFKGRFFENYVVLELLKSFNNNGKFPKLYYYRDNNQNEVDLVFVKDAKINLVEIKCGNNFNSNDCSDFTVFKGSNFEFGKRAIICSGSDFYKLDDGTLVIPSTAI